MARVLRSRVDHSVNFVQPHGKSYLESRLVPKRDYISAYVSSHTGCRMACKFCWLTDTGQTSFRHASGVEIAEQLRKVIDEAKNTQYSRINVNFMARGEPLANKYVLYDYGDVHTRLQIECDVVDKPMKVNISTIMPTTLANARLRDVFRDAQPHLYYSIYSVSSEFRKKWMPNAMDVERALENLRDYQEYSGLPITFHFALIDGENDSDESVRSVLSCIEKYRFVRTKYNVVRFNPPPSLAGRYRESPRVDSVFNLLRDAAVETKNSRVVPRAGPDVFASCGMFYND